MTRNDLCYRIKTGVLDLEETINSVPIEYKKSKDIYLCISRIKDCADRLMNELSKHSSTIKSVTRQRV